MGQIVQWGMMFGTVVSQVLVSWCPVVAEVFLGLAASEPPEAHVNGLEHFVYHGFVGDACGSGVVALNGVGGLRTAHLDESVPEGYHGIGADEEAGELGFSGGRHDLLDDLGYC